MFAIYVISLILSTALAVDQSVAQALANDRNNKITREATKLYNQITKDKALVSRLIDAYNRRDTELGSEILNSSPFGSRMHILKQEYAKNKHDIANANRLATSIDVKNQEVQNRIAEKQGKSQTSGSAIVDLISGTAKDPTKNPVEYNATGITENTIQEVNYGKKK